MLKNSYSNVRHFHHILTKTTTEYVLDSVSMEEYSGLMREKFNENMSKEKLKLISTIVVNNKQIFVKPLKLENLKVLCLEK